MAARFARLVCAVLWVAAFVVSASQSRADMDAAMDAFDRGDLKTAFKEFLAEAEAGNAVAQFNVALMYAEGLGVKQDYSEAAVWYRNAAEQGNADAQYELGELLYWGDGVPIDLKASAYWAERAAEQGQAEAQLMLGDLYYSGEGVPLDLEMSAHWTRLAAEQGLADAQYAMGLIYLSGEGVDADDAEALRWMTLAANQGHAAARFEMGEFYYYGNGVPVDLDEAQSWYELAAAQGHVDAQKKLDMIEQELQQATVVDPTLVGEWELYVPNGQSWSRWTLAIAADGTYVFQQDGQFGHSGTFQARDGSWHLASQTNGWSDGGTYQLPDNDTFNMVGKLGPGSWHRVTN